MHTVNPENLNLSLFNTLLKAMFIVKLEIFNMLKHTRISCAHTKKTPILNSTFHDGTSQCFTVTSISLDLFISSNVSHTIFKNLS